MKAVVKIQQGIGNTELKNVPKPKAGYKQVVLEVKVAGLCGTDIRFFTTQDGKTKLKTPVTLGHEGSGVVVEVGDGVKEINIGDRVVCETTFTHCGKCEYCIKGYYNLCIDRTSLGSKADGFFAEYVLCDSERIHKLPNNVSFEAGAMVEALSCCVHGVLERSSIKAGDTCVVFGPGPIGNMTAQIAQAAGANVYLVGTSHSKGRLELAKKVGIKNTLIFDKDNIEKAILEATDKVGADVIFECSGSNKALDYSFKIVKKLGEIILASAPSDARINLWDNVLLKEINLIGFISSKPTSWNTSIRLLKEKKIDVEALVSHRFSIDQWKEAFELGVSKKAEKILIYPDGNSLK